MTNLAHAILPLKFIVSPLINCDTLTASSKERGTPMSIVSWLKNHFVTTTLVLVSVLALLIHVGHSRANAQNGFVNDNNGAQDEKLAIQIGYAVAPGYVHDIATQAD